MNHVTYLFPVWLLVVLIPLLAAFYIGNLFRLRLVQLERAVYGPWPTGDDHWQWAAYHRAASEAIVMAVSNQGERIKKLHEAETYGQQAMAQASTALQRKFTAKLLESIPVLHQQMQGDDEK